MTTTQHTPYDAVIAEGEGVPHVRAKLKREGYLRAKAEDAVLLEAAELARNLLELILADCGEFPIGKGSDEAETERETLLSIACKTEKALTALRAGIPQAEGKETT